MKYAIIENGKIVNTAVCDDLDFAQAQGWIACPDHAGIDWDVVNGEFVDNRPIENFVPDAQDIRFRRNALLAASDWTQLSDAPVNRTIWAIYRQALRDLPQQAGFPSNVQWPVEPMGDV